MIRVIQRRLIIPRGDTGTFTVPALSPGQAGSVGVFTIFDPITKTRIFQKQVELEGNVFNIEFGHGDTVNLQAGDYLWDIKFYKNPIFADNKVIDGEEIDSYYAAFQTPKCEIRETGDAFMSIEGAHADIEDINLILAATQAANAAKDAATEQAGIAADKAEQAAARLAEMIAAIPTKVSELENDSGYLNEETDPTVPAWAKAQSKPTYTPQEVGALPDNTFIPSRVSDLVDDSGHYTKPANGIPASDLAEEYATKTDTVLDTTLSRGRKEGTTVGEGSFAFGENVEASGNDSFSHGYQAAATGTYSHAEGNRTNAAGNFSHAEGQSTIANGFESHAEGISTIANGEASHVEGRYNVEDGYIGWPTWVSGTQYEVGDKVIREIESGGKIYHTGYICKTANADTSFRNRNWTNASHMNYAKIIGNGTAEDARSNAFALTWTGDGKYAGDIYVHANPDSTGGVKVATVEDIPTNVSDLTNDAGYLTQHQDISGKANSADLAAVATSGSYEDLSDKPTIPEVPVQDVQIDGTSILENGVANIPLAQDISSPGLFYTISNCGFRFDTMNGKKVVSISSASPDIIKTAAAASGKRPITPINQHYSTFYGLAKAAGDSTQAASDNAVGTYTDGAKTAIRSMLGAVGSEDYATANSYGLVKVNSSYGITQNDGSGALQIVGATAAQCKSRVGSTGYQPLTVYTEDASAFYGLAYAAGDTTMTSSSNAIGTYTDSAKASIKSMLGIVDGSTGTVNITGTTPSITAVENTRYVCGEVSTLSFTPAASGICIVRFTSGSTATVLTVPNTVKFPEWFDITALEADTIYEMCITDGVYGAVMSWVL